MNRGLSDRQRRSNKIIIKNQNMWALTRCQVPTKWFVNNCTLTTSTSMQGRYYHYYPHFMDKEMEFRRWVVSRILKWFLWRARWLIFLAWGVIEPLWQLLSSTVCESSYGTVCKWMSVAALNQNFIYTNKQGTSLGGPPSGDALQKTWVWDSDERWNGLCKS